MDFRPNFVELGNLDPFDENFVKLVQMMYDVKVYSIMIMIGLVC